MYRNIVTMKETTPLGVVLSVGNLDDYELREGLRRMRLITFNIALTEDEPLPGWSRFYITDPWGNRIELLERGEQ